MKPRFKLILEPLPGGAPVIVRLRRALKMLLRAYGFRAVYVNEDRPGDGPAEKRPIHD